MTLEKGRERAGVVAVTFNEHGGGIAALSRLTVDALHDARGRAPVTVALVGRSAGGGFATGTPVRAWFGLRVAALQAAHRCDWLLFTHLSLATVQRAIPSWCRLPYAVFLHDVEAWQPLSPGRSRVLANAFIRIANSDYTARRVAEANPGVGAITACPLALPAGWSVLAQKTVRPTPERRVVIVGRMVGSERYKGHDQLLEAWPRIVTRVPAARLVCVGEGDDVERLRAKARSLGVANAVEFTGFVSDETRRAHYEQAAVFAMPSRREGFGLVYLEAMASGLPCIGSIHDAAPGVIANGETGWLVDQANTEELAVRIARLLENEPERCAMGEAGRRRFLEHFTFDAFANRLVPMIEQARESIQRAPLADARQHGL